MSSITYLNGEYLPLELAKISPMDRGCVFGDGVYEVLPVYDGKVYSLLPHIERLHNSLKDIHMQAPHTTEEWQKILQTLADKNGGGDQLLYLQITRGFEFMRSHAIPDDPNQIKPTIFAITYPKPRPTKAEHAKGVRAMAVKDIRWKYCHIKTTARLAYVLMYNEVKDAGFDEGIIMHNDQALEGLISNIFIVRHGVIITPPKSHQILSGITREKILNLAAAHKIPYRENKITEADLLKADELWITNSTRSMQPVLNYNGHSIGNGKAGPMWERIWDLYWAAVQSELLQIA